MQDAVLDQLQIKRGSDAPFAHTLNKRQFLHWWHGLVAAIAIAGGLYMAFPPSVKVQLTQVVAAYPSQQYVLLNSTGYVVARRKASVASKGTGRLEWLGVSEGSEVKAGEVVARLESRDVEATLQAATANVGVAAAGVVLAETERNDAALNLRRTQDLHKKNYTSQMSLDDASARLARSKASVLSAQASLTAAKANENFARNAVDYTHITAPFDGVVIAKSANVGDVVTPLSSAAESKGAVVVMADMSSLAVDADVSESALGSIRLNQPCEIVLDAFPEKRFRGVVDTIVPTVNRSSATVTTKVRFLHADRRILPDMSAKVSFLSQAVPADKETPVAAVNPDAIVQRGDKNVVYTVNADGVATEVFVIAGATLGAVRAVSGALKVGDAVVLTPSKNLRNGARVVLAEGK